MFTQIVHLASVAIANETPTRSSNQTRSPLGANRHLEDKYHHPANQSAEIESRTCGQDSTLQSQSQKVLHAFVLHKHNKRFESDGAFSAAPQPQR